MQDAGRQPPLMQLTAAELQWKMQWRGLCVIYHVIPACLLAALDFAKPECPRISQPQNTRNLVRMAMPSQRNEGPCGKLVLIGDHDSGTKIRDAGDPSPHGPFPAIAAGSGPCRLGPASDGPPSAELPARRRSQSAPSTTRESREQHHKGRTRKLAEISILFAFSCILYFRKRKKEREKNRETRIRPPWPSLVTFCVRPHIWRRSAAPACRAVPCVPTWLIGQRISPAAIRHLRTNVTYPPASVWPHPTGAPCVRTSGRHRCCSIPRSDCHAMVGGLLRT